jgi:hypothetical protein
MANDPNMMMLAAQWAEWFCDIRQKKGLFHFRSYKSWQMLKVKDRQVLIETFYEILIQGKADEQEINMMKRKGA